MKNKLKKFIGTVMGNNFIFNLLRYTNREKLLILYYHRITKKEDLVNIKLKDMCTDIGSFETQMKFLSQSYNPIGEKEILSAIEGTTKIPRYSVWVTFDDGYKDNYTNAYPILKKYKIPATFFITTGFINKQAIPCEDYIAKAIRMTHVNELKLVLNKTEHKFYLNTEESKNQVIRSLWKILDDGSISRDKYLKDLFDSFKIGFEDIPDLFMNWNEIKEISNNGFYIGGHTVRHKIMSTLSKEEVAREIIDSKDEIEKQLGKKIFSFAYPSGKGADCNLETCFPILETCGFKLGVTTIRGVNSLTPKRNYFNLKRMGVSYEDTLNFFKVKVSLAGSW